jgi:hypothetical protein
VTKEDSAYSGDNPRGVITLDGKEFYMVGNADSTTNNTSPVTGPGLTIGARLGVPNSTNSIQLGTYVAADRPASRQRTTSKTITGAGSVFSQTPTATRISSSPRGAAAMATMGYSRC